MIRLNNSVFFAVLLCSAFMVSANSYNSVKINDHIVKLSNEKLGYIIVDDMASGKRSSCKISNWNKRLSKGAGMISLTSDGIGVLLYSGKNYLKTSEVLHCKSNPIKLYSIPDLDGYIDSIVDVNFDKKTFLSLYLVDVSLSKYKAKVSYFGEESNLLTGKGFWSDVVKKENETDDAFTVSDEFYIGKISANGMYVAPNDLDCSVDSFPGVWDIVQKKKVVFIESKDDEVLESKCKELFSGEKTLSELGGELIDTK